MQIPNATSLSAGTPAPSSSSNVGGGNSSNAPSFQSLLSQLNIYANATPAQSMENSILAQLGITPQQLAAMTPAQRQKVETEVQDLLKKEMQAQQQQSLQQVQQQSLQQASPATSAATTQSASSHISKKGSTIDIAL
jgi:hypothetical protein